MSDAIDPTPVTNVRVQRWINSQVHLRTGVLSSSPAMMTKAMPRHIRHAFEGTTDARGNITVPHSTWRVMQGRYKAAHQSNREMERRVRRGEAKPVPQRKSAVF